jgi:hypothetical protein
VGAGQDIGSDIPALLVIGVAKLDPGDKPGFCPILVIGVANLD